MNRRRKHHALSAVFGLTLAMGGLGSATLVTSAVAQESPFSNASLHGTYAATQVIAGPNEPFPNFARAIVEFFDGEGNVRWTIVTVNRPELDEDGAMVLDEDGNVVRDVRRSAGDQSTWGNANLSTYEVSPYATWVWVNSSGSGAVWDGVILETEVIDGVLTATKLMNFGRDATGRTGGGVNIWIHTRIADGDWAPPAQPE